MLNSLCLICLLYTNQNNPTTAMRQIALALMLASLAPTAMPQEVTTDQLANRVRAEFLHAWQGYKKYAWGHDAYKPLSKTSEDRYGVPFYITALEALDAMMLMRLDDEADSTREFLVTHLSFDKDVYVPTSEFATRLLGSLIASYQLSTDKRLLDLADDLGTRLLPAFVSPTGMPYREVNLKTGAARGEVNSPSGIGTLLAEFGALAMITGKPAYFNHAKIALLQLYEHRSSIDLAGEEIDITTGEWTKTESHLGAGIGSYYEDILKCAYLFDDADCGQMWQAHYAAINRYLLDSTATGFWYGHAEINSGKRTKTFSSVHGASFPAAQALFRDTDRAERTMQSCYSLWTKRGIQPELFNYKTGAIEKPGYDLNPEILEAAYTLHRTSGNAVYLHMGKAFLDSLITYCKTDEGYAALTSVITKSKKDHLDPWFFAGTMKYLYLLFTTPEVLDFSKVIMNSQGHPIRKAW
jgi:mannosidase alpha-like ER degradation enhancer 2